MHQEFETQKGALFNKNVSKKNEYSRYERSEHYLDNCYAKIDIYRYQLDSDNIPIMIQINVAIPVSWSTLYFPLFFL